MKAKQDKAPAELAALACYATGPNKSPALNREPGAERWAGGSAELLPPVLDACCGSRMFWFDRADKRTVFVDKRRESHTLPDKSSKGGSRELIVNPDLQADFTALPFGDGEFALVVFDPPHLVGAGKSGWLAKKYGVLQGDWRDEIRKGFAECFRVLRPSGTLVFKWNEEKIPVSEVLELTPEKPLFGNRCGRTAKSHWLVFLKGAEPVGSQALDGTRASSHSTMNLRTYRPELPPNTIYRPHTLLERLCRETPPPAPKRTFRHAPKEPADVAIGDSLEATRQNATEALTICLAPETGEQPLPPIQDGPTEAPARQHRPTSPILIAAMMAAAMMPPPGGRRP